MIKTLIIDDEQHCIDRIVELLSGYKEYRIIGMVQTIEEAVDATRKLQPDLVFLDIHIQQESAFDYLRKIENKDFDIIFTTAHDNYAIQAFKFSAFDYLLKPISKEDFNKTILRYEKESSKAHIDNKMEVLLHNLQEKGASKKISIPTLDGFIYLKIKDIIRCQADSNYTHVFLQNDNKITIARTLKSFEELLEEFNFYRIHNSHLINLDYVIKYTKGKGGYVTLTDKSTIEVSVRRRDEFLKRLS